MKCAVCQNDIGLWTRLSTHSAEICKPCHQQASERLRVLLSSVAGSQSFKIQFAEGWISQFEETVRKYRIADAEAGPQRFALLNSIFKLVESEDHMPESDLKFVVSLVHNYRITESPTPEIRDTLFRLGMREAIQSWESGEIPKKECNGLLLQRGEVCHWEEGAGLRIQRTKREYVGSYSSVSVPVPLVRGVRFKVGGFRGHPVDHQFLEDGGTGLLHITNQKVCFTGAQHSVAIPFKKIIGVNGFEGGFIVQTSNEKKPGIFIVRHPEFTTQMLTLASNPPEEEPKTTKRQKRLPPQV